MLLLAAAACGTQTPGANPDAPAAQGTTAESADVLRFTATTVDGRRTPPSPSSGSPPSAMRPRCGNSSPATASGRSPTSRHRRVGVAAVRRDLAARLRLHPSKRNGRHGQGQPVRRRTRFPRAPARRIVRVAGGYLGTGFRAGRGSGGGVESVWFRHAASYPTLAVLGTLGVVPFLVALAVIVLAAVGLRRPPSHSETHSQSTHARMTITGRGVWCA